MLQQLEFKLSVEKQYKEGIEKMLKLYQIEGDRRSKAETESKRLESLHKIQLLTKSRKRYSDMHIDIEEDMGDDDESLAASNLRRPLTGNLHIGCYGVKEVDHVAAGRFGKLPECFVTIKVEDQTRAKTKTTRGERWYEEFDISVDKANEVEIAVYDKSGDHDVPVGLMWLRISDIAEALRRKKVENELNNAGWVSAAKVHAQDTTNDVYVNDTNLNEPGSILNSSPSNQMDNSPTSPGNNNPGAANLQLIDSWFVLEPVGQIHLVLGFEKSNRGAKRAYDGVGGLGRQGAIRQKKEDVHEVHGHKFVQQQFYNVMK